MAVGPEERRRGSTVTLASRSPKGVPQRTQVSALRGTVWRPLHDRVEVRGHDSTSLASTPSRRVHPITGGSEDHRSASAAGGPALCGGPLIAEVRVAEVRVAGCTRRRVASMVRRRRRGGPLCRRYARRRGPRTSRGPGAAEVRAAEVRAARGLAPRRWPRCRGPRCCGPAPLRSIPFRFRSRGAKTGRSTPFSRSHATRGPRVTRHPELRASGESSMRSRDGSCSAVTLPRRARSTASSSPLSRIR